MRCKATRVLGIHFPARPIYVFLHVMPSCGRSYQDSPPTRPATWRPSLRVTENHTDVALGYILGICSHTWRLAVSVDRRPPQLWRQGLSLDLERISLPWLSGRHFRTLSLL